MKVIETVPTKRRVTLVLFIWGMLLCSSAAHAVEPLTMRLELEKDTFVYTEPIYVKVLFKNNTDDVIYVPRPGLAAR